MYIKTLSVSKPKKEAIILYRLVFTLTPHAMSETLFHITPSPQSALTNAL
jgi:hypothetical protein